MTTPEVTTGLKWLWDNRTEVRKLVVEVRAWFSQAKKEGDRGILIIGPGGVGKTTLGKVVVDGIDWLVDSPWEFHESYDLEHWKLGDGTGVELVIPPGQFHRRESTWNELGGQIAAGKYRGVVFLAAAGYHSPSFGSYREHPLFAKTKANFLSAYRDDCRAEEIKTLERFVPFFRACSRPIWWLTFVAKQDLWFAERSAVEADYRTGNFGSMAATLLAGRDGRNVRYEIAFGSLLIANLITGRNELLKKTCEGYDQKLQIESVRGLLEALAGLQSWEARA